MSDTTPSAKKFKIELLWLQLFFKIFFILKYIKMIFFKKIIFKISASKQ